MKFFIMLEDGGLPPVSDSISSLSARWPGTAVKQLSNPDRRYALEFSVPMSDSALEGLLDEAGESMTFEGASHRFERYPGSPSGADPLCHLICHSSSATRV